jgi:hypothetical protein
VTIACDDVCVRSCRRVDLPRRRPFLVTAVDSQSAPAEPSSEPSPIDTFTRQLCVVVCMIVKSQSRPAPGSQSLQHYTSRAF